MSPAKLHDARKAIDAEIDQLKFSGGPKQARSIIKSKMDRLLQVREGFNTALDIMAGKGPIKAFSGVNADAAALRAADALNAQGAAANSFRSLKPRVNVMQSVPRFMTLPFVVPAVAGGLTAAAGLGAKVAPYIGRAALGAAANDTSGPLIEALKRNKGRK